MIEPGAVGEVTLVVGDADTAIAYASGDVPVLATPRVLALAEQAAVTAMADEFDADQTSVGIHAELHHLKATKPGTAVTAQARVLAVDGKKITFEFHVMEADVIVAQGTHQRVIVPRERFV
ncbi:MAG: hotdog domain-containing protein [Actinomycetota bacterium]|nr:hotdog domain-containing protein [Actinomycetota bacterium]